MADAIAIDTGDGMVRVITVTQTAAEAGPTHDEQIMLRLHKKVVALTEQLDNFAKTADGVIVQDGQACFLPCAKGVVEVFPYLAPHTSAIPAYPWDTVYSTAEAARAAKEGEKP